jgi:predicted NBD/HSP70 family sugar kinase
MAASPTAPGSAPQAVLAELADGRLSTVAEISKATGLPRSTVVHALTRLAEAGTIEPHEPGRGRRGRPSRSWSVATPPGPIAVVVTAAHGTVLGVTSADGRVLAMSEAPPLDDGPDGRRADGLLGDLDHLLRGAGLGPGDLSLAVVGLPGPSGFMGRVDDASALDAAAPRGHLRRFRTWDGHAPAALVGRHLGCPVYSENDANLAALGEAASVADAGTATVLYVSLAHGTGAGLVIGGALHRGRSRLAGEVGHLHSDDDGRLCQCGAHGCFWQRRSIPALLEGLSLAHGRPFTVADIAGAAAEDDPDVVRALLGFGHALGRRLADAVVFIDPDAIILDSTLGAASDVIATGVKESIRRYAPPTMARATKVLTGRHGAAAAVTGGAALARTEGLLVRRTTSPSAE